MDTAATARRIGVLVGVSASLVACGGGSKKKATAVPVDPVSMALKAPGVRTAIIPKQRESLTIVVPPCGSGEVPAESTEIPEGSNQVVIPKGSLTQSVAVQPCIDGQEQSTTSAGTVLLSPGGAGPATAESQSQGSSGTNQLVIPENSDLRRVVVPPCIVVISSSSSSSSSSGGSTAGNTLALPASGSEKAVVAPPCVLSASSSSSSSGG